MQINLLEKYKRIPVVAKASIWFVFCSVLQKGIAFLTTPIFTRLMSTEQYGQVTMYNSWLEIFTIFATLNLFYGVYNNALTKYSEDKEQVTSSMLGLCTTITLCVFVLYLCFQGWINKLTGMSTLMTCILFGEVLFIPAFRFWSAKQRFEYKYKALVFASLVISILTPLLGVPAVLLSTEKGYAKILTGVFSQVLVAVILYVLIFKNGRKFYHKNYWKYALAFNLPLIPHYLSSTVLNQCDRVMIDNMCGTDKAGIYGLAYTIGALAIIFNEAIMNSFTPWTYQHLKAEKYEEVKDVSRYLVVFIAIISLGIVLVAPEIVWILGGEKYAEGAWIIAPIAASIFFRFLYGLYGNIEFYYEENYFIMVASMICAVLNIILNYVFIKQYGYLAAGFTTLACYAFYSISHYVFSTKVLKKHTSLRTLYDNKFIFTVGLVLSTLCIFAMKLFSRVIIRYSIIVLIIVSCIIFRNKIIEIVRKTRKH